jgi:ParB family transcriptional regulator, chromosome partitioning protein
MSKKVGLPDFMKMRHDYHLVDELAQKAKSPIIRNIPMDKIIANEFQPRKDMGELNELMESIKEIGIIEPVIVRPREGNFEIIAGERRFRAAKLAGLKEIPCVIHDIPDNEALEISIVENIQRKDLNLFEESSSLKSLAEIYGYTHQEIAQKVGKSRVTITELIRLTDIPALVRDRCLELSINSKTFLLELVKTENEQEMMAILEKYANEAISRDELKMLRKEGTRFQEKPDKEKVKKTLKTIKFKFVSDDKNIKINFNFRRECTRESIIEILKKLIQDIEKKENWRA